MFNSRKMLSREDIDTYGKSQDVRLKNSIEQKSLSDSFNQDAFDGWGEASYDTTLLKTLDKKFSTHSNSFWYWMGGMIAVGTILLFVFNPFEKESLPKIAASHEKTKVIIEPSKKDQTITLDESDVLLSESIDIMNMVSLEKQLQPKQIKSDFAEMIAREEIEKIELLPALKFEEKENHLISNRQAAKEIYLSDLKLIDYSVHRSMQTIQTKQVILTGTPANKEDSFSDDIEASWKTIDVPYMDFINRSIRLFNKGNYKKALSRFETVQRTYPDDINANFYGGLCLYNFGEYQSAIASFNRCLEGNFTNFDEESLWMTALSYEQIGDKIKSKRLFKEIEKTKGFYSKQAKSKLSN